MGTGCFFCDKNQVLEINVLNVNNRDININNEKITMEQKQMEKIEDQQKKFICKIKLNDGNYGIGFFCQIPFADKNNDNMNILICHNKIYNEIYNDKNKDLNFSLIGNDFNYKITIDDSRKKYCEENYYETAIIEIKDSDNLKNILFLEIDYSLDNLKFIYSLPFYNAKDEFPFCSNFKLSNNNSFQFSNRFISLGCPIINLSNNKVIGISKSVNNINNYNIGIFLKEPIEEFIKILEKDLGTNASDNINKKLDINPYIKTLLLCFYKIEKLQKYFQNNFTLAFNKTKLNNLTSLICKFMKDEGKDNFNRLNIIKDIEEYLKENNKNIKIINFECLINIILTKLHQELNRKENNNSSFKDDDYDENMGFNNFQNFYLKYNESDIQKLFFGFKEIITNFKCCGLKKYFFEEFKYIYFDEDKFKKGNDLQNLISEFENFSIQEKKYCKMCCINSEETLMQKQIYIGPEILIIIINNNNKVKINFEKKIKTKKFQYQLISCIIDGNSNKNDDFNIIFNIQNKFYIQNEGSIKEIDFESKSLTLFPYVFFYQKETGNKNNNYKSFNKEINEINNNNYFNFKNNINNKNNFSNNDINNNNLYNNYNNIMMKNNENINFNIYNNNNISNPNNINNNILNQGNNYNNIIQLNNNMNNNMNNNIFINPIINNNQNININSFYFNNNEILNINNNNEDDELITLYFTFSNQKQLYINVKQTIYFKEVINELESKYTWIKNLKIESYLFEGIKVSFDKTLQEIGLKDNSTILIIEY